MTTLSTPARSSALPSTCKCIHNRYFAEGDSIESIAPSRTDWTVCNRFQVANVQSFGQKPSCIALSPTTLVKTYDDELIGHIVV